MERRVGVVSGFPRCIQGAESSVGHLVRRLRYRQLALLVAIGEQGNLHRAAEDVHVTQPSATKVVRELENLFGCPLFLRLPRGMCPTECGADVLTFARRALVDLQLLAEDLNHRRQGSVGQLRIGTLPGAAGDHVARAIAESKRRHPLLSIKLCVDNAEELIELLLSHKIDLAIGSFVDSARHGLVVYEPLGSDALSIVVPPNHPATGVSGLQLRSLSQYLWILPPVQSAARQIFELEFAEAGLETPANVVESTSYLATLQLVQQSDAVAMIPESVARPHVRAGLITRLPVMLGKQAPSFGILSRRGERLSGTAEFADLLRRSATQSEQEERAGEETESQRRFERPRRRA